MCCDASAPTPPDYSGLIQASTDAAKLQSQTSADQLAWAKQQYADQAPITKQYVTAMTDQATQQTANAEKDRSRYESIYQPMESSFAQTASGWNSPARADAQAASAKADVNASMESARNNATSNLESFGIDPSQTRFGALDLGSRISQAAAGAAAGTQSRQNTQATGLALQSEAINIGRGYPGQVAQSYAGAQGAGGAGISAALGTSSTYGNLMGTAAQWSGLATNSINGAVGATNAGFQNRLGASQIDSQNQANQSSGIGALVGVAGTAAVLI